MTPEAISWLNQFSHLPLNDHQRLALIYLRQHSSIDNRDYRRLNRVDVMTAGQDLRGMVQAVLIEQTGFGRWTKYTLKIHDKSVEKQAWYLLSKLSDSGTLKRQAAGN